MEEYFLPYFKDLILPVPIYRVQREQDTKRRLRARGSFRISKGCYFGGPWDKSEPP